MADRNSVKRVFQALTGEPAVQKLQGLFDSLLVDLAMLRLAAGTTDTTAIRAEVVKLVTDYTAGRAEIVKLVTDYTAGRAEIVKLVTDITEVRTKLNTLHTAYMATLAKLDLDAGVTDTNYAATNPSTAPNAVTAANPAAVTAANPAAVTAVAPAAISATATSALTTLA